jgi:hypothetical protein
LLFHPQIAKLIPLIPGLTFYLHRVYITPVNPLHSMRFVFLFLLLLATTFVHAQSIENVQATFADGLVVITYDLKADANLEFSVSIYSSHNNYSTPLKQLTGDVGTVKPGMSKRAVWDVKTELITYRGDISFRVKGTPLLAPLVLSKPTDGGAVRRGKTATLQWKGGIPSQNVTIELFQGSERVESLGQVSNSGTFSWSVPSKFEKGKYTLKLSSGAQTTQADFSVKAKVPMLLKVLPLLAAGGAAAALAGGGGGGGGESDLPGAPVTPDNN